MRAPNHQDLLDLVDGAAIFSAGGEGDPEVSYRIADKLAYQGYTVKLVAPLEVPDKAIEQHPTKPSSQISPFQP